MLMISKGYGQGISPGLARSGDYLIGCGSSTAGSAGGLEMKRSGRVEHPLTLPSPPRTGERG
jgi:hypothetical protein